MALLHPGSFKFVAPSLHRFVHCTILRRWEYYGQRFGIARQAERGMIADFTADQSPWHRHYRYRQIRALAPGGLETLAWAVYYPAFRALWTLRQVFKVLTFGRVRRLPAPLNCLNIRLSRMRSFPGDQLTILFRKTL